MTSVQHVQGPAGSAGYCGGGCCPSATDLCVNNNDVGGQQCCALPLNSRAHVGGRTLFHTFLLGSQMQLRGDVCLQEGPVNSQP